MGLKTKIKQSGKRSLSVNKRKPSTAKLFNLTGFRSSVSLDIGLKKQLIGIKRTYLIKNKKFNFIIPVYNEAQNIESTIIFIKKIFF